MNPSVTLGMLVARYMSVTRSLLYIVAQTLGGIAGAGILYVSGRLHNLCCPSLICYFIYCFLAIEKFLFLNSKYQIQISSNSTVFSVLF